jgi:transposase
LNLRGNRILNHAIHIAAVTQLRHDTNGRVYFDRKIAEGKTPKEAIRALKRRISDAVYKSLIADTRRTSTRLKMGGSGRTPWHDSESSVASLHPES